KQKKEQMNIIDDQVLDTDRNIIEVEEIEQSKEEDERQKMLITLNLFAHGVVDAAHHAHISRFTKYWFIWEQSECWEIGIRSKKN
ncbi:MAG: hypothetical protein EZS28_034557, partial [Streblomastix strix]